MDKNILALLTWEDIKEIVTTADAIASEDPNEHPELMASEMDYYRGVLKTLWGDEKHYTPVGDLLAAAEVVADHMIDESRSSANAFIRKMVAHRMMSEGFGSSDIGRAMGKSHATVIYLSKCMNDMLSLPVFYRHEVTLYKEFEARAAATEKKKEEAQT